MVIEPGNSGVSRGINSSSSNSSKTQQLDSHSATANIEQAAHRGEEVSLSAEAKVMSQIEKTLQSLPEVDSDRVATIKQSIASGTYTVNTDIIAENFIAQDGLFD